MNILYKKCGRGHINKFMESEEGPELCSVCGLPFPFGADELRYDECAENEESKKEKVASSEVVVKSNKDTFYNKTRFSLIFQNSDTCIDIPDDADKVILGRQGLGSKEKYWGKNISRKHLLITSKLGGIFVEDPGSTNGTMVNGEVLLQYKPKFVTEGSIIVLDTIRKDVVLRLERNI